MVERNKQTLHCPTNAQGNLRQLWQMIQSSIHVWSSFSFEDQNGIFWDFPGCIHAWLGGGEAKEKKVKPILTPPSFFSLLFLLWYLNHNTEHKHCRLDLKLLVTLSYKMTGTHWSWIHFTDSTNTCHQSLNNAVKAWNHHHTRSVFLTTYCDA